MPANVHTRPIHLTRWRNFRALIGDHKGAISEAAAKLGKLQGQVSHFGGARPIKNIGDDVAEQIEQAYELAAGSLDLNGLATEKNSGGHGGATVREVTRFSREDAGILVQAEKWVRFEERGQRRRYDAMARAARLLELCHLIAGDGGTLSPEHSAALIDHARKALTNAAPQQTASPAPGPA